MKNNEPIFKLASKIITDLVNLNWVFGQSTDYYDDRLDILIQALDVLRDIRDETRQGGVTIIRM